LQGGSLEITLTIPLIEQAKRRKEEKGMKKERK